MQWYLDVEILPYWRRTFVLEADLKHFIRSFRGPIGFLCWGILEGDALACAKERWSKSKEL